MIPFHDDFDDYVLRPDGWQKSRPAPITVATPSVGLKVARTNEPEPSWLWLSSGEPDSNDDRTKRALFCLSAHQAYAKSDDLPRVADLLADLMHYCKDQGVDFAHELNVGADFFEEEKSDDAAS